MENKPFWESKTILASLGVIVAAIAQGAGLDLAEAEIQSVLLIAGEFIGGVVAIYGRIVANSNISAK